ncbi:unnamed protein product [Macrosiphum euphorbiae]|uniref:RRM domain-containing protein n=1 Tax=Macrosiphum euphorbiae TaxID=13131 RepID=A0AAV0WAZ8_9HEMI|nr:unnamed protein product [Macrosiphum euphorbiae]
MNGVNIEGCCVRLGFGKTYPSKCVWITGIDESGNNSNFLLAFLADCGTIINYSIDRINKRALVYYNEIVNAEAAINKMKHCFINGVYLRGDYASLECQIKFAEFFNKQNDKKHLSIDLDNIDIQNTFISNVNKQKLAVSHYGEADNTYIASKEFTSEITCIWVDGIADSVTNEYLESHFSQFGPIHKCLINRFNKCALLYFQEELHAQSAVTAMNGSYIEGKQVYVRLASLKCRACDVPNINNNNVTIQLRDNTAQSSPYSALYVDPSCKCSINDETYPINISDPRNSSINVHNAQYTSQDKYLKTYNIDIPTSKTIYINNSSITIKFNEYPPERLKSPTQYANSDILSLPLPEFAKNISKELTSTSSRYSLSSNAFGNQDTYTFNVHHNEMINYGLRKTDNQDKKQEQNNNHPHTSDAINTDFVNPISKDSDRNKTFLEIGYKFRDEYPKDQETPSNWLTNTSNYNCVEKLDHWCSSETSKKEKEGQKNVQSKQKSLNGFVAENSIEFVVQPNFVDVEKSTNIDEEKIDNDICETSIANILLTLKTNYQNKIIHNETKDKQKNTNCNKLAGSISNNGNNENNKSVYYNHVNINEYKNNESQNISSTRSMGYKSHNIKSNKIQGEAEKTNVNEYISKDLKIKKNKEFKKPILYFDNHEKKNNCKKTILDSKSTEPTFSKCSLFEFDMFKIKQTINKKKETKNKDCKFNKGPTTIEEEKQNLNILKSHENSRKDYKYKKKEDLHQNYSCFKFDINNDNKSTKYIKEVDGNITSSHCSTENSLKRSLSNTSEYHNDSKRWKTDNKTYKNDSTKTSKHHSQLSKPSKNIHNNSKPENKKSKLNKTPNQPRTRGWTNGFSMFDILSSKN